MLADQRSRPVLRRQALGNPFVICAVFKLGNAILDAVQNPFGELGYIVGEIVRLSFVVNDYEPIAYKYSTVSAFLVFDSAEAISLDLIRELVMPPVFKFLAAFHIAICKHFLKVPKIFNSASLRCEPQLAPSVF